MSALLRTALAVIFVALSSAVAMADDWVAVRLRGVVLQLVDREWQKLSRGDIVSDSRVIRTLNGNVELERGGERVALGANTQIQIYDEVRKRPFTTVKQYFGTVSVEAEVQDVQHFAVQTHYLAAVVKGTRFTVTAGEHGAKVAVERGSVFVEDRATRNDVTIVAGQSATVDNSSDAPKVSDGGGLFRPLFPGQSRKSDDATDQKPKKTKSGGDDDEGSKPNKGKSDKNDDRPNKGKSDDDKSGKNHDKSNSGKNDDEDADEDDNSGHGNSDDDDDDDNSDKDKGKSDKSDDDDDD